MSGDEGEIGMLFGHTLQMEDGGIVIDCGMDEDRKMELFGEGQIRLDLGVVDPHPGAIWVHLEPLDVIKVLFDEGAELFARRLEVWADPDEQIEMAFVLFAEAQALFEGGHLVDDAFAFLAKLHRIKVRNQSAFKRMVGDGIKQKALAFL